MITHTHTYTRTPSRYGFHLNANGVWNSINLLSLQSENMLLTKVSRRAKDGYWAGNHGSDLVLFESNSNLGWLKCLCVCMSPNAWRLFSSHFEIRVFWRCHRSYASHLYCRGLISPKTVILHLVMPLLWEIWRRNSGLQSKLQRRYKLLRFNRICLRVIFNWLHPTLNNGSTRGKIWWHSNLIHEIIKITGFACWRWSLAAFLLKYWCCWLSKMM